MDLMDSESEVRDFGLERLMMLTDAVYAIALTLLALDLKAPEHWDHRIDSLLSSEWSTFFAYLLSFGAIASFWASQRQMSGRFRKTNFPATFLALVTLGLVTLIPVAAKLYSEAVSTKDAGDAPFIYLAVLWGVAIGNALQWGYCSITRGMMKPEVGPAVRVVVFGILLTVSPILTWLGAMTYLPDLHWLPFLMAPVAICAGLFRRWATRSDEKRLAARTEAAAA